MFSDNLLVRIVTLLVYGFVSKDHRQLLRTKPGYAFVPLLCLALAGMGGILAAQVAGVLALPAFLVIYYLLGVWQRQYYLAQEVGNARSTMTASAILGTPMIQTMGSVLLWSARIVLWLLRHLILGFLALLDFALSRLRGGSTNDPTFWS